MSASQEEVVKDFVRELQSIVESRPPVSKAKMMSITKAALRAVKYYKHVVMNVEKFIIKCKPEYKIPGLYVIDSVIRQSRHQYGIEKDVFGSRFAKNILVTLEHLERCSPDDKNKISRVLNLWEKNSIFPPELIKQLFETHNACVNTDSSSNKVESTAEKDNVEKLTGANDIQRFRELQETLKRASAKPDTETTSILTEIQQITNQLLESQKNSSNTVQDTNESLTTTSKPTSTNISTAEPIQSNIAHVLDDFDYGSDHDDDEESESHNKSMTINTIASNTITTAAQNPMMKISQTNQIQYSQPPPSLFLNANQVNTMSFPMIDSKTMALPVAFDPTRPPPLLLQQQFSSAITNQLAMKMNDGRLGIQPPLDVDLRPEDMEDDNNDEQTNLRRSPSPRHSHYNRRRSRSRSRSPSRSRESKRNRSSSNSNSRRDAGIARLQEAEKRERHRKGLPPLKENHLVVISKTLWLGHLSKTTTEADLKEELEPYGEINDINHIISRGCAFVCFKERSDALRCLEKMKDVRFHGNPVKMDWAMNKGVKDRFKLYWNGDHGCTYIPYSDLKDIPNLTTIAEGGAIDEDSIPSFLKANTSIHNADSNSTIMQQHNPTLVPTPTAFSHADFQSALSAQSATQQTVHLDPSTHLAAPQTILMAPHQGSSIRVGLPVQMMPPGAQIIQVQPHPHPQAVQVVQRIPGGVFPNGQIIHQVPFGSVLQATQSDATLQLSHRAPDFKDINAQGLPPGSGLHIITNATGVPTHRHFLASAAQIVTGGPTITTSNFAHSIEGPPHIQYLNESHHRLSSASPIKSNPFDEHERSHRLSKTDEQLMQLSNQTGISSSIQGSSRFVSHPSATMISGTSSSPSRLLHSHQHANQFLHAGNVPNINPSSLLPTPTKSDENHASKQFKRRPNRFEPIEEANVTPENNSIYGANRGGTDTFIDRNLSNIASRIANNRGRGNSGQGNNTRGYYNNNNNINTSSGGNDRSSRSASNDIHNTPYRGQSSYNRGGRGDGSTTMSQKRNSRTEIARRHLLE